SGADPRRQPDGEVTRSGADVGDRRSLADGQRVEGGLRRFFGLALGAVQPSSAAGAHHRRERPSADRMDALARVCACGQRQRSRGDCCNDEDAALAARAIVIYHLAEQRAMMGAFLDALGIAHENGLIQEDNVKPDKTKVAPAAAAIAQQYPPDDVSLYLSTLLCQDPETWSELRDVVKADS